MLSHLILHEHLEIIGAPERSKYYQGKQMNKSKFKKGDLIEIRNDLVGASKDTPAGMLGFVVGFHSFQKGPYDQAWYDVHLADGRTMMMLGNWFKRVNK